MPCSVTTPGGRFRPPPVRAARPRSRSRRRGRRAPSGVGDEHGEQAAVRSASSRNIQKGTAGYRPPGTSAAASRKPVRSSSAPPGSPRAEVPYAARPGPPRKSCQPPLAKRQADRPGQFGHHALHRPKQPARQPLPTAGARFRSSAPRWAAGRAEPSLAGLVRRERDEVEGPGRAAPVIESFVQDETPPAMKG